MRYDRYLQSAQNTAVLQCLAIIVCCCVSHGSVFTTLGVLSELNAAISKDKWGRCVPKNYKNWHRNCRFSKNIRGHFYANTVCKVLLLHGCYKQMNRRMTVRSIYMPPVSHQTCHTSLVIITAVISQQRMINCSRVADWTLRYVIYVARQQSCTFDSWLTYYTSWSTIEQLATTRPHSSTHSLSLREPVLLTQWIHYRATEAHARTTIADRMSSLTCRLQTCYRSVQSDAIRPIDFSISQLATSLSARASRRSMRMRTPLCSVHTQRQQQVRWARPISPPPYTHTSTHVRARLIVWLLTDWSVITRTAAVGSHQPSRQHDDFLSTVDALATSLTATSPATMPQSAELHTEARTMHGWKNSGRMDINSRIQTSGDEPWLGCVLLFTALLFAVSLSSSAFLTTPFLVIWPEWTATVWSTTSCWSCCLITVQCDLAAVQCIVIGLVCGSVTTIKRNRVHRSSPNWVCR